MKKLAVGLSICLALLLGVCVVLHFQLPGDQPQDTTPSTEEEVNRYTVRFEVNGAVWEEQTVQEGQMPQNVAPQVKGLRMAGWKNEQGETVDPFAIGVSGDVCYTAVMYPVLEGHQPYLFTDEEGLLHPDDALTADALALALEALAAEGAVEYFPQLPEGSDVVTDEALCQILSNFFEEATLDGVFAGEEADTLTRSEFAVGMNRLLGVSGDETVVLADDAQIPVDVIQGRTDAADLLEAAVAHEISADGVTWAQMELPVPYEPGFVNVDGWLYYVTEDHYFLRDADLGRLHFGPDGRYTCGDAELDATVAGLLDQFIDAEPDADRLTLLRRAYDYCHQEFGYRRTYDHPAFGETGWEIVRAKAMFEKGKGNCYSFAAIFWALARGLGYEARAMSGTCLSDEQPHSWCIIELNGKDYFFDPEWQFAYTERGVFDKDMFKIPMNKVSYWGYKWTEE